jgi:hypothetical protein
MYKRFAISAAVGTMLTLWAIDVSAAPPAAPVVTTGADIKQLQFDWDIVPRSNYYEFWYKSDNGAPWVKFSELKPWQASAVNNVGAHLFNWDQARYQVKACNYSGCAASADIGVHDRMLESIGYFKADQSAAGAHFGAVTTISEDGQTLAAFVPHAGGAAHAPASFYVFAKTNGHWAQQGKFEPSVAVSGHYNFGFADYNTEAGLALSADGNTLAVNMPMLPCANCAGSQILWVYTRNAGTWKRTFALLDPNRFETTGLTRLEINDAGDRIALRRRPGRPWIILARSGSTWTQTAEIPEPPLGQCIDAQMSGDISTLARLCHGGDGTTRLRIARAPDWQVSDDVAVTVAEHFGANKLATNYTGSAFAFNTTRADEQGDATGHVYTVRKLNGAWQQQGPLLAGSWTAPDRYYYGAYLAWSRNGGYLAVSDKHDTGQGIGVLSPPLASGGTLRGAIYLYQLRDTGASLRRVIKPNTARTPVGSNYVTLDFANDGKTLLIGDQEDDSNATGIDGNRDDASLRDAGALWLY